MRWKDARPCAMSDIGFGVAYRSIDVQYDSSDSSSTIASFDIVNSNKCKQDNGHADDLPPEPMLPPCRICSEKASGFHYGANTCEACKAFFRRSLHKGTLYVCAGNGTCEILPGKRNSCAACRLKKCLNNGMSKSAIKTGRYTHAKRARDIMEVKGLKGKDTMYVKAGVCNYTPSPCAVSDGIPAVSQKRSSLACGVERRPFSPVPDFQEMEQIIQCMTSVQLRQSTWTPEFIAEKNRNEKLYLEQRALHQQIFSPVKSMEFNDYVSLYQMTGVDIDGRRDLLQSSLLPLIEAGIKRHVVFVKSIPGFVRLPTVDQIALVKASRFDCWMILSQPAFNIKDKLYTSHDARIISIKDLNLLCPDGSAHEELFEFQRRLQRLSLTEKENCTLAAMCVMATDNCDLADAEMVARSHSLLFNCFLHLVEQNHSEDPLFIARVVSVLVELRSIRERHTKMEEKVALQWSNIVEIPPILYEMWSSL